MNALEALLAPRETARALRAAGVVGMNERNHGYTLRHNRREHYPRVDDKLATKRLCERAGVPTARVLGIARFQAHGRRLLAQLSEEPSFVLKPAHGAMGNGILVVRERHGDRFVLPSGTAVGLDQLAHHTSSILSGMFSLGGQPDVAFAEELLIVHPELAGICLGGVPDLRFVIFQGVPVMAMTRLPTRRSGGRANLHQGAVGCGVDLATGRTTHASLRGAVIDVHPDSGEPLVDVAIPDFQRALEIAVRATAETEMGYVGADVVVDARYGALILELNARPGLAIQVANQRGLAPRLRAVERHGAAMQLSLADRIAFGREIARRS